VTDSRAGDGGAGVSSRVWRALAGRPSPSDAELYPGRQVVVASVEVGVWLRRLASGITAPEVQQAMIDAADPRLLAGDGIMVR
jgi:hypothetical protein